MLLRSIVVIVMSFCCASVACAAPEPLSLGTFTEKVLAYYPALKAARSDVDIALAQKMQARAGFWPSLDLAAGYTASDDPVSVFGMLLRQERFTSADFDLKRMNTPSRHQDLSAGLYAGWPLFDAMQTIHRARAAASGVKAAQADESFARMEALLLAQDAYLNALTLARVAILVDDVWQASEQDLKKASDLKDRGMILGADYYAARAMFGEFTRMKNELERQQKAMMALLNILMGEDVDASWSLPVAVNDSGFAAQDLTGLFTLAQAHRADLAALEARLTAASTELAGARATVLPRVELFAAGVNDRNKITAGGGNNYTVGVKGVMVLADPARGGRIREAAFRKERLEHDLQRARDAVRRDIVQEVARHEALRANMSVLKGMSMDMKESVALIAPLYSEGRKSIVDLMEARGAFLQVGQAYDRALAAAWMSEARLLFLVGKLDATAMRELAERSGL